MQIFTFLAALYTLVASLSTALPSPGGGSLTPTAEAYAWADSVCATMTPRERVAQLFVPRLDITANAAGKAQLTKMVDAGVGGFLLGKGTIDDYTTLIALGQKEARIPLLVTLDGEWGLAMRIKGTTRYPYNMALGAIQDSQLLYEYGAEVARQCRALGIHVDFAPVMDVNSNPSNPVIGYRSFGEDPARVAALGTAYSRGMESAGVLTTAKHFPGHGDTSVDSHKALPTVDHSRQTLNDVDLLPFRQYIGAGMSGVMVGHLCVPALDNSGTPTSLSSKIVTDLLKGEMGFKGLVWTDALAMKGANSSENNCVRALRAGADVLLGSGAPLTDIDAVVKAVADGKVTQKAVDERCRKILAYKYMVGLGSGAAPSRPAAINAQSAEDVNRRLCTAVITCLENGDNLLPVRHLRERTVAVVSIGAAADNQFTSACRRYAEVSAYGAPDGALTASQIQSIKKADVVIVGVFSDSQVAVTSLSKLDGVSALVPVFFLNPYKMSRFATPISHHHTLVTAFDDTPMLREYAAQAIFGGIPMTGRCPVNIKGVAKLSQGVDVAKSRLSYTTPGAAGVNPALTATVDTMVRSAINAGAMPGCQVLVAKDGQVILHKAYGSTTRERGGVPVTTGTLFDIASMTKATATTGGIMRAIDEGLLRLDDTVGMFLPETDSTAVGDITIRQLLTHTSGLPPTVNVFTLMMDTATYVPPLTSKRKADPYTIKIEDGLYGNNTARLNSAYVRETPSDLFDLPVARGLYASQDAYHAIMQRIYAMRPSGNAYKYSDLNFCLLMAVEEAVTGVAHDQWVETELFAPLGMPRSMYRPVADHHIPLDSIAVTETDNFLRRQRLHGFVHDEIAAFSGGVQGNAGLFSTASDIAAYSQMLLQRGVYGGEQVISTETVDAFTTARAAGGRRALGFDLNTPSAAPKGTFGHTGFTGTCFWIDPQNQLIFIFLSNRVCPSRSNGAWSRANIRSRLLAAVYAHLR